MDIPSLQKRLGVAADGDFGPLTATALFTRLGAKGSVAAALGRGAAKSFKRYGLLEGNGTRLAHFLGQVGHESGGFRYMEELATGAAYEGRKDLGNVKVGDGRRYKGRGPLQLTGRANYRAFGAALDLDLENDPEIAADPAIGILIACEYWQQRKLNALADADDTKAITRRVNGGENGLPDRFMRTLQAKALVLDSVR
ncbi:glycoside hydrolase [Sphingomonas sp. LK11]|uniref:glycoside hydrolase family 19 protein n=1 Tax=Sphingomonas sp. LK11 TaxID=1390395 RepID=UPI000972A04E|nr:glycoside hydrolase family 19 protein [Sphingomonas sp. LK11]APX65568.1 glycoside hydrolase [Sphingomonas sp. LK11]